MFKVISQQLNRGTEKVNTITLWVVELHVYPNSLSGRGTERYETTIKMQLFYNFHVCFSRYNPPPTRITEKKATFIKGLLQQVVTWK